MLNIIAHKTITHKSPNKAAEVGKVRSAPGARKIERNKNVELLVFARLKETDELSASQGMPNG